MPIFPRFLSLSLVALLGLYGCSSDETSTPPPTPEPEEDAGPPLPDPICLVVPEGPYPQVFVDVTGELGLGPDAMNLTGSQVTVGDLDGDHWPDMLVTRGSNAREDLADPVGRYRLLRNEAGSGFSDVTWPSNLFVARDGTVGRGTSYAVFGDVDNDGDLDAFSVVIQDSNAPDLPDRSSWFLNDGTGNFVIGPDQPFTPALYDPLVSAALLDYDRDGLLDLFAGHHYGTYGSLTSSIQDSLYRGDGFGGFVDVSEPAGVATRPFSVDTAANGTGHAPTWGVTACDLDGDGWTDLMTTNYGRQLNHLYRNTGGAFEDLTMTSGFAADDNLDYSENQFFRCYCEVHPDAPDCVGGPSPSISCDGIGDSYWNVGRDDQPWRLGGNSSNTVCGDVDNDGDMDLLAVELAHWHIGGSSDLTELLLNDGFPAQPLSRPGNEATGLTRDHIMSWNEGDLGGALVDFDNDGRLDVLVASSDYPATWSLLWQQQATGTFVEIGEPAGARVHRAHGIGVTDYDRDGDYDLVLGTSLMRWESGDTPPRPEDSYAYVLRNESGQAANKLLLHLVGAGVPGGANRDAVGARVTVQAGGRTFMRELQGSYGLTGFQQDHLMIIGIGAACTAEEITVRWPNAAADEVSFTDVLANYVLIIEEGAELEYQPLEEFAPR